MASVAAPPGADHVAVRLLATGLVQGVGFRPAVHRLASGLGLAGWVRNTAHGVEIAIEGPEGSLALFRERLAPALPPLARLDDLAMHGADVEGLREFRILESRDEPSGRQAVSPDVALCAACAAELADPSDRRHQYPFITCTDCGPRFTVIEAMPYDRVRTSMREFVQCATCAAEYAEPGNRRFHSETNSCAACGPALWYEEPAGERHAGAGAMAALDLAARALRAGRIVAVRGLGGFHLAVDATSPTAVERLRARKHRESKPLAVMVADLAAARRVAALGPLEAALLTGPAAPVVLVPLDPHAGLAPAVAPRLDRVGVMLAYTPLHRLLLERAGRPLVMTSGNASDEPIVTGLAEARTRLAGIADGFLMHDREIISRYDDSVVRVAGRHGVILRRARGHAPLPVTLPVATPRPLLAMGPHLKHTFTLATGTTAWVSQHIGDLDSLESLEHFRAARARLAALFRVEPEVFVRDMHPGYLSSRLAEDLARERGGAHVVEVQHHHAHVAAVMAEHGRTAPVVGLAFDGTGWGPDGTIWGGECLVADLQGYRRAGRLRPAPMPGGDLAARRPWRAALGYASLCPEVELAAMALALEPVDPRERAIAERQVERGLNAPWASSVGRLFDAAAAILGIRHASTHEGQAAMELEALAGDAPSIALPFPVRDGPEGLELDPVPLLVALGREALAGADRAALSAGFHEAVARAAAELASRVARDTGIDTVVLGGGVFQNALLLVAIEARLEAAGLEVLVPRILGPNDGAISYGQAAVAAARLAGGPGRRPSRNHPELIEERS